MIDKYCNDPKPINRDQQAALGVKHTAHLHAYSFTQVHNSHKGA